MKIINVQNAQGQLIIIQHYVAMENMYVYMYAHICSIDFASHPVASKNRYSTYEHTHIYMFVKIQKIIDFQQSHGPPIIIQHSGAIEDMHVYMYAHICSICFCQPPCGKQKYIKHIWAYIYKGMHLYRFANK